LEDVSLVTGHPTEILRDQTLGLAITNILVVEDKPSVADTLQRHLVELGYHVPVVASTVAEALVAAAARRPDLVLMDLQLGDERDGIQAAARLRERCRAPIVYLVPYPEGNPLHGVARVFPMGDRSALRLDSALEDHRPRERLAESTSVRDPWCLTTLESIGDGVITTDLGESVTYMNAVAERLTGWSRADAQGQSLDHILQLVDEAGVRLGSPAARAIAARTAVKLPRDTTLVTRGGVERVVEDSAAPILDGAGALLGCVIVFRDVTETNRLERRVAQAERLASIGTMTAGIAHEINNPLTYVLANITLALEHLAPIGDALRRMPEPPAEQGDFAESVGRLREVKQMLAEAAEGAERVHRIVRDLKKFARTDAGRARLDLADVLESAVKMTANVIGHRAQLTRDYAPAPLVEASEGQLIQVFTNLLGNAAEAIPEGDVAHQEIHISTRTSAAGDAVVEIHDSGVGIPHEVLTRVFDAFFTTKPVGTGTGLGLSICRAQLQALGGDITAQSAPGAGTTFRVTLPAARAEAPSARISSPDAPTGRRGRALVIDDEPAVGRSVARMLQTEHDVTVPLDARSALARLRDGERYDVIFCDLTMPNMTGIDLYRVVVGEDPELARRFVFMTGGALSESAQSFLDVTGNIHVSKPLSIEAIRAIVDDFVRGEPGPEARR
jgi:two-component system cell cycle sensor histidine kinase/response regulator CckA